MKKQIKAIVSKLFVFAALAVILTGAVFAQKPQRREIDREKFDRVLRQNSQPQISGDQNADRKSGAVALSNQQNFKLGKDFALVMFDAEGMDEYEEALNYTIVELVYLIDDLEGQAEAAQLQKILKAVVRGTTSAAQVRKDIEAVSKTYLNRQKADQKWYFNSGNTSMNLLISTYLGDDPKIKEGLSNLQALIKIAPKSTPKTILDPINSLAKYVEKTAFTEEDYMAIYEGAEQVIEAVAA